MCDEHTIKDEQDQPSNLTRREFNTLAAGASVAFSFPALANPLKTVAQDVDIPTADGICDASVCASSRGDPPRGIDMARYSRIETLVSRDGDATGGKRLCRAVHQSLLPRCAITCGRDGREL